MIDFIQCHRQQLWGRLLCQLLGSFERYVVIIFPEKKKDELILLLELRLVFLKLGFFLKISESKQGCLAPFFKIIPCRAVQTPPSAFPKKIDQVSEALSGCCCLPPNWERCLVPQKRAADLAQLSHIRDECQIRALPEFWLHSLF